MWLLKESARSFLCVTEPMPAESKVDSLLTNKSTSDGGDTSGMT